MKKREQFKLWIKEHEKIILAAGLATGGAIIIGMIKRSLADDNPKIEYINFEEPDFGRNCIMKFFVEETGEQVGKDVRCTESFAQEFSEFFYEEQN